MSSINNHIHRPRVSDVIEGKKFKLRWHGFDCACNVELESLTLKKRISVSILVSKSADSIYCVLP